MNQNPTTQIQSQPKLLDTVAYGDCIETMRQMSAASVDFVLTDPPYLASYRSRDGRTLCNDSDDAWLKPAFAEVFRVLKRDRFCISFYGWAKADRFFAVWRAAGFYPVGHLVFRKAYTSSARFVRYQHEQAYLLAKGSPQVPTSPIPDVLELKYTGNELHPTQKSVSSLLPLIQAFSAPGELILDPFCGSGSMLIAAHMLGRHYLGIELDAKYHAIAAKRLHSTAA